MSDEAQDFNPTRSFLETVEKVDLSDIAGKVNQVGFKNLLDDSLLRQVPIINWVIATEKTVGVVRDWFLVRKLLAFLRGLAEISIEERRIFAVRIESDSKLNERVGENLLILLDRYDHIGKAEIMSKIFCVYGRGETDYRMFLRLSTSLERAFIDDIYSMLDYFAGKISSPKEAERNLYSCGFADFYVLSKEEQERVGLEYPQVYGFNKYGKKLGEIVRV